MAEIIQVNKSILNVQSDGILLPLPARIRKLKMEESIKSSVLEVLKSFAVSFERYKEFSKLSEEFDKGQIEIYRDANFSGLNIEDVSVPVDDILDRIENQSKLIIILPIKTREDKPVNEGVYLSSLRTLSVLLKDHDFSSQLKSVSIPSFPSLLENLEKVKEIFKEDDFKLFICDESN